MTAAMTSPACSPAASDAGAAAAVATSARVAVPPMLSVTNFLFVFDGMVVNPALSQTSLQWVITRT